MGKELVAKGQATITTLDDAYHISQSVGEYVFPALSDGTIAIAVTVTSAVKVTQGNINHTDFSIGAISKPAGFNSIAIDNVKKTVTYSINAGTTVLADHGTLIIPVIIGEVTYTLSFGWAKARAGTPGVDSNLLDWVNDWNNNKTEINKTTVITPKIFAGVKHSDGTLTGTAIGQFALSVKSSSGSITTETVEGIYGFKEGHKIFFVDNKGNAGLGYGEQCIKYNASTGKIEFSSGVSLQWTTAINQAKTEAVNSAAATAQSKADAAKNAAISASTAHIDTKISELQVGGDNLLQNGDFRYYSTKNDIGWDEGLNGNCDIRNWGTGYNSGVSEPSKGYHAHLNVSTFSFPVLELINKNSSVGYARRWMGISTSVYRKERLMPGCYYTFSADLMVDTAGMTIHGGLYSTKKNKTAAGFNSGSYSLTPTVLNQWQRLSYTFLLDSEVDLAQNASFYIYGHSGAEGIAYVRNVSLQAGTKGSWVRCQADVEKEVEEAKKAGTDARVVADALAGKANSEGWATKLTYIDKSGIFTGTLSANVVNALKLNASQITSGTIAAARLDVTALKASLITAGNIEALTLKVTRGTVGGWTIDSDSACRGTKNNTSGNFTAASGSVTLGSNGLRGFKWRLEATGAGALAGGNILWDASGNVTFGSAVTLLWSKPVDSITAALGGSGFPKVTHITGAGIYTGSITASQITAGTISADRIASGSITATKLDAASIRSSIINTDYINGLSCTFSKGKIGGWTINTSQIYKNNVCLGSDGSIANGTKWKLNNDGSGQIAGGNISWNSAGTVAFSAAVSLNWKNDIEAAKTANYGYRYYNKIIINGESNKYYPVIFKGGEQSVKRDILIRRSYSEQAPADWDNNSTTHKGGLILLLKTNFGGWGGASYSWDIYELSECYSRMFAGAVHCGNSCMFAVFLRGGGATGAVYHLYSDQSIENTSYSPSPIPAAPQIAYSSDLIFQSGDSKSYAPAPRTLTSVVENEIRRHRFIALAQSTDTTLTQHPLTYIGSTGIYTGTLTAAQVNAVNISASSIQSGTLSADRIAAGSISATKLDATSIRSSIINTDYINGLSCTFTKGRIGGFTIGSDNMSVGAIGGAGATPLQIRSASAGSGYWYTGAYRPLGVALTWHQSSNAGHIVFGQVAGSGSTVKMGFIGIQMMAWDNTEYFCLSANYTKSGGKEVYNRIAGWAFDHNHIWKNNISLGSDGSIANGTKWKLNNDGSGQLAGGNISWNASGTVTFASSVSSAWASGIATTQELASAMAFGKMLYRDPTFYNGNNSVNVYNNSGNGTVTITRQQDSTAPNDSKYVLLIKNTGTSSPYCGGFYFGNMTSYRKIFVARIIARIPSGREISYHSNSIGTGGSQKWLTSTAGTGEWREYVCKVTCGTAGFSSTNFFALTGAVGSTASPVQWSVAYATVFDVTSTEKYTTTIDGNGIYTGTVRAGQVVVDSALVVGGSSYNGSISVRDAGNAVKVTLDRSGITAIGGRIGGFTLSDHALYSTNVTAGHTIGIQNNGYIYNRNSSTNADYWALNTDGSAMFGSGKIKFNADGSGYIANQNISWDTGGNVTMSGTITATAGKIAGFTISGNKLVNTASDSGIEFSSMIGSASLYINTSSALISMRADSSRTGISIQTYASGARGMYILANAGSKYAIESYGPVQFGQRSSERWCVPGVLYVGCKYSVGYNNYYYKVWGDGLTISSFSHIGDGKYRVYHNLNHTNYTVMAILWSSTTYYGFFRLLERTSTYFVIQNIGSSGKADAGAFDFIIMGRNVW